MSTFIDLVVIDLYPGPGRELVLADCESRRNQPRSVSRMEMGAGIGLIEQVFAEAGAHVARILVESNSDEYGAEHVVLTNRDGLLTRTQHINVDAQRTDEGVPYAFIELITTPPADLPDDLLDGYPAEILADPITVVDLPEFHHVLRSGDGAYGAFPWMRACSTSPTIGTPCWTDRRPGCAAAQPVRNARISSWSLPSGSTAAMALTQARRLLG
ncbi:hypothetical protein [Actinomadura kijaniata]|uniref:hypothetical protein n=1 Tax=Actinomadura kijaniata TaxID=46161 RepID=UPI0012FC987B|nr:hypothetical protein [Actinomadura kijaniata]